MPGDDPFLQDARQVRLLSGLSGARVLLMTKDNRRWFVRKVAKEPAHNDRLRRQMAKQVAFARAIGSIIRVPEILEHGELEGLAYFDMEFVRGTDGVTYLRRSDNAALVALADKLCSYVEAVAKLPADHAPTGTLFEALYGKLCAVQRKTPVLGAETLARMFTALERVRDAGDGLRATMCHGDLTLENIVVDDGGQIWMLDLLDAPFEHYWQDIAKLHQDLEGGWYRLGQPAIARYVLDYLGRRVMSAAVALDPRYSEVHAVLLACTFVRILPYVRTEKEQQFVKQRVEHFARSAHGEL